MSSKLNRIVQMDAMLRSGSYPSVAVFRERFEVSERTVYDDVAYFKDTLRAPIQYSRSKGGYHYTDVTWTLPNVIATEGELLAFFLSAELTRRYLGTSFEQPLRNAIAKLSNNLPAQTQLNLDELAAHFTFQPGATAIADPLLLMALNEAMGERWRVKMTYFTASSGERNERVIEPYHLYNVRGDWQVIAFDNLRRQFRNFAVSRIEQWEVLRGEHFSRDADFSPSEYLAHGFLAERSDTPVEVVIWFDAYQARYMRGKEWHPSQQIEEHDDGALTLRFQSGALDEIRRWVMSFGRHACALAPASLIDAIIAELRTTLRWYQ